MSKHLISREKAEELIAARHRQRKDPTIETDEAIQKRGHYRGGVFDRDIFDAILAQEGCTQVAVLRGAHEDRTPTHIVVGVNAENAVLWDVVGQIEQPCPPFCPKFGPDTY